ncbi:MAG: hypothetical protein AAF789_08235 [Bacteroidota bacterium]
MTRKIKSVQEIASLSNSGLRVAPFNNSSEFMELHRLDYKRKHLMDKLRKAEIEISNIERNIDAIGREMSDIINKVDFSQPSSRKEPAIENSKRSNTKVMTY